MNDTMTTVVGNVVDSPRFVRLKESSVTNFRMAATARRFDGRTQQFVDSGTLWIDVECWNDLSRHVSGSVSKGDPVIVHGALTTHSWDTDNGRRSRTQLKALAVGHNLARGLSTFQKSQPARRVAAGEETVLGDAIEDRTEEAYAAAIDLLTGEVIGESERVSAEAQDYLRGRDYVDADEALHGENGGEVSPEPANA